MLYLPRPQPYGVSGQCQCDDQFRGQPGGPCTKITCPVIPEGRADEGVEGIVESCSNDIGDECHFLCHPGYIRAGGSATVTCLYDGSWSGGWPPMCTACPLSTFKAAETVCTRCPENSGTNTTGASAVEKCDCLHGYASHSDKFCHDVDECLEDNGGCQQTCSNLPDGYVCQCTRPGYERDTTDISKCIRRKICIELQPPDDGGLVCHMESHTSTTRCTVKCNPGFEFIIRTNKYDECGPATNWLWSHDEARLSPAEYLPCVPQFYPSVTMEAEVAYFVENCDDFDEAGTQKVQDEFLQMLQESGICLSQGEGQDVCRVEDVQISCSYTNEESPTRFRRAVERRAEVRIKFNLKATEAAKNESKCTTQCSNAAALKQLCLQDCNDQFQNNRSSVVEAWAKQIGDMLSSSQITMSDIFPSQTMRYTQRTVQVSCAQDMISFNGSCVPCPAGSFVNSRQDECIDVDECEETGKCQHGYQNTPGGFRCFCPSGYRLSPNGRTCQDIDECKELKIDYGRDKTCFNRRGDFICLDTTCPDKYQRHPGTEHCVLQCADADEPCPPGARYADILEFRLLAALPCDIAAFKDLKRIVACDHEGVHLYMTTFTILVNDIHVVLPFGIHLEKGTGVVYSLKPLKEKKLYRMQVRAESYDRQRSNVKYKTSFLIFISVSPYPY